MNDLRREKDEVQLSRYSYLLYRISQICFIEDKNEENGRGDAAKKEEMAAKEDGLDKDKNGKQEEEDMTQKEINEQNEDEVRRVEV